MRTQATVTDWNKHLVQEKSAPAGGGQATSMNEIIALGLERQVAELEVNGYTVIENAMDPELVERLRRRTLEVIREDREVSLDPEVGSDDFFHITPIALTRGRPFEEALMHPLSLALITYLLGPDCRVSDVHLMVKGRGATATPLHTDTAPAVPDPFPAYAQVANATWILSDYSDKGGAICFVPGSHRFCRNPRSRDLEAPTVAVEAPKGSLVVFHGNLWHGSRPKETGGLRLNAIYYFARLYFQPQCPYNQFISKEIVERNPPRFAKLVGCDSPYGWRTIAEFHESMPKFRRFVLDQSA